MRGVRRRFWVELAFAIVSVFLVLLTLVWRDWIEEVFGVDPDGGNGSLEWLIAVAFVAAAIAFCAGARREWRRTIPRRSASDATA
jgi:hypothetical protein